MAIVYATKNGKTVRMETNSSGNLVDKNGHEIKSKHKEIPELQAKHQQAQLNFMRKKEREALSR